MADVCTDLKDELVTAGVGVFAATSGWSIWIAKEPTTPHQTVTLYQYGSAAPNPKFNLDEQNVQIRIRGDIKDYLATYTKAQAVKDALLGLPPKTINSTYYAGFWMVTDVIFLKFDDNNRPIFVTNFRVIRQPPVAGTNRIAL